VKICLSAFIPILCVARNDNSTDALVYGNFGRFSTTFLQNSLYRWT
jgi:hypothetical protein